MSTPDSRYNKVYKSYSAIVSCPKQVFVLGKGKLHNDSTYKYTVARSVFLGNADNSISGATTILTFIKFSGHKVDS